MLELLFSVIESLGAVGVQEILSSAWESMVKKYKDSNAWKNLIVGTGKSFIKNNQEEVLFFSELKLALSKENLSYIAKDLNKENGYDLKNNLYKIFMNLMSKYGIPYEIAESYTTKIIYEVLEQLKTINPEKYERYFIQEWREEQKNSLLELQNRIDKIESEFKIYTHENVKIISSGNIDVDLRRKTCYPSIGVDFFIIDDENFKIKFNKMRYNELVFIRGRSIEETIFCVLNELWRLDDRRPIYVVMDLESWNKLQLLGNEGNVYIPWFYAEEIAAIENNTNIFVIDENVPVFGKSALELRPRTRNTLLKCLKEAGLDYSEAYSLISETHGLYSQMKKRIFKGEFLKTPEWMVRISDKAKKTCLLIGSWEEVEGDKLIIESLYGDSYDKFIEEVIPYAKGEDPLIYMVKKNGSVSYFLSSIENIWSYVNILNNEKIWKLFTDVFLEVVSESENLFTYDNYERLVAQFKGKSLFWSETIRRGMLTTLMIKATYKNEEDTQMDINKLVEYVLESIKTEKQWIYISKFWKELCEISPIVVIKRIEDEWNRSTGLLSIFKDRSNNFFGDRSYYIDILWGIEQFLSQKEYFWQAFRWLLKLDSLQFKYESNSPMDILKKVFCTWMNFTYLETAEEKIRAAEIAFEIDYDNTWECLFSAIDYSSITNILCDLSVPKYREHHNCKPSTIDEMKKTQVGFFNLLLKNMDFSVTKWKKVLELSTDLPNELREKSFKQLLYELSKMSYEDSMQIKNEIRYIIYKHRYFESSDWSMSENNIIKYEKLLDDITINVLEYEYNYLFKNSYDFPLLHPVTYDTEGNIDGNLTAKENLIKEKILEFQDRSYDLDLLATICAKDQDSTLGRYLSRYWNSGNWDYSVFKCLLSTQKTGQLALEYLDEFNGEKCIDYNLIIEDLVSRGYSLEIVSSVYRIEASKSKSTPMITDAPELIKNEFWKKTIRCDLCNDSWVLKESKKYAALDVYLAQLYQIHYRKKLSAEIIFDCFSDIEKMPISQDNKIISYYVERLISVIQEAFIENIDKCNRISQIEIFFGGILEWENMKCLQRINKMSPDFIVQLINVIFKKDNNSADHLIMDNWGFYYSIYNKAHFCPAEVDGKVDENNLEDWVKEFRVLLIENNQESLFTGILGRLFSFSPLGKDGHEPCEAVRRMIEKYGDEDMTNSYQCEVINRRGVFAFSAGKEELEIAEGFKKNAEYLELIYPKTAKIFYNLYKSYEKQSKIARIDAENCQY